ncbi:hypothetical protein EVAR_4045_1 [Eumeta japonica]|uniref:Uncharacterized protein n=1 Tax=Eumeta variegata TaxID=151549 RepID=A0A4C1T3T0_EUMVA|nr:hypothetical protein EVAR_4045_1 [Eumeta japonica]
MATPPQLKCMQLTCATDAPPIKCSGSGASGTVASQPSYCEAGLNKEVKSERKRCPSFNRRHTARNPLNQKRALVKRSNPRDKYDYRMKKKAHHIQHYNLNAVPIAVRIFDPDTALDFDSGSALDSLHRIRRSSIHLWAKKYKLAAKSTQNLYKFSTPYFTPY